MAGAVSGFIGRFRPWMPQPRPCWSKQRPFPTCGAPSPKKKTLPWRLSRGALDAAAFGFAAVVDLPLAVAPVLAGAWAVALLDGVGSLISVALSVVWASVRLGGLAGCCSLGRRLGGCLGHVDASSGNFECSAPLRARERLTMSDIGLRPPTCKAVSSVI